MYRNRTNPGTVGNTSLELSKIVEGTDIFNSELLYRLTKFPQYKLKSYTVKNLGLTPSSVSHSLYGDLRYSWILIVFNPKLSHLQYSIGDVVSYPDLMELQNHMKI